MHLIVAATDGSKGADRAVDMAATLAKAGEAKLLIITIENRYTEDSAEIEQLARNEGGIGEGLELIARNILQQAKERARRLGASSIEVRYCWGDPAEVIMEIARHMNADVVVVGRRGRGRLAGLLLGSVSQKLVSLAPCAVVVVP